MGSYRNGRWIAPATYRDLEPESPPYRLGGDGLAHANGADSPARRSPQLREIHPARIRRFRGPKYRTPYDWFLAQ